MTVHSLMPHTREPVEFDVIGAVQAIQRKLEQLGRSAHDPAVKVAYAAAGRVVTRELLGVAIVQALEVSPADGARDAWLHDAGLGAL